MKKNAIRRTLIDRRLSLPDKEVKEKGLVIQKNFLESSIYAEANNIAMYSSFKGEVETDLIFMAAIKDGKCAAMPKINWDDFSMRFISLSAYDDLVDAGGGFMEPAGDRGQLCEISDIDLFIVPGVAYDINGKRLGMGKGCYDRALDIVSSDKIVALAYEFQVIESVPSYRHDVSVGWIITEKRMITTFNKKK